jgi:acyl-CoA dehydrogenase
MPTAAPWMDEELTMLQDSATRLLQRELSSKAADWERDGIVDRESWRKVGEAGLLLTAVPEAYGGGGGGRAHELVVQQAMYDAGVGGGLGAGIAVHSGIVAGYILSCGTEEQKLRWLPKMASGELIAAVAMTEPGTGSDLQSVRTTARKIDGGYVVNGSKTFISNGQNCGLVVVVAKTDPEAGGKGVSLLVLETEGAEGFRRGRNLDKIGMHSQDTSELFFDDVFVPTENLLGGVEGRGFYQLMQELAWERVLCAFGALVMMEEAVAVTIDYVKQRKAFGKAIIEFQNTQFVLAECKTQAVVGRAYMNQVVVDLLAGDLDGVGAAMAKSWVTETLGKVVDACLQMHGGYGYMTEYRIAQLYADARVQRIFGGTTEIMKLLIGRSL